MQLRNQGLAFLPDGGSLPGGSYPVYLQLDVTEEGAVTGEVHFASEPKYPRPISIGKEFDIHAPHPDSILGDNVVLRVKFVDKAGSVAGYVHGSPAQFHPELIEKLPKTENAPMSSRDVFVIHGRDERLRSGMFHFLRSLDLNPIEWTRAVQLTGKAAPYVGEVLDAAFSNAQAVVVLLSPDDLARLRPDLCGQNEPSHEVSLTPQARPNVLFEAGMAMARHPDRTVLVEIGPLRPFSDIGGRHTIRMDNSPKRRQELAQRLQKAGCPIDFTGTDWQTAGDLTPPEVSENPQTESAEPEARNSTVIDRDALADVISELEDNLERARAPRIGDAYVRPSSQVWRNNRNKLTLPDPLRSDLANVYREIDGWLTIVESGVHPNMGSPPLNSTTASLKTRLPGFIEELKKLR